ncbi:bifunctional metallophosphatase/5'-nucleotidase [Robertmurraya korlensis]|uniref:bifunctional metallophosphatase/5'-nucleotidase n=1 Tax=Robertmurraya korlensis TaxID=519977 RepID=UPI00203D63FA|nr:bifunctional UDP-sugar hydrolase/5'-nucleotidase [Robertmurraya korlensis]MCM3600697.1 bifunctional metallophosphatase/5'-nucleotidase [Robertmurraya korlensis]
MTFEDIHIYHTNDLHSHFEHWTRISSFLQRRRDLHQSANENVLLFDIGDHMDRWHPLTDATRGKRNTELLNEVGYTAVTIGNNEGITLSFEDLDNLYQKRTFDVIVANFFTAKGTRPQWVEPYHIYELKNKVRVAVIGLTAYFSHFYAQLGWKLSEPMEELKHQLALIKEKADIIILLSHLGIHDDEAIAEEFPEIDVILGAHTHHVFHEGKEINDVILGAAGKYGMFLGHITLTIDCETRQVTKKRAIAYDSNKLPYVENEKEEENQLYEEGKALLFTEVARIREPYRSREVLARLLCETLRSWCNVDSAFLNEGLILHDLPSEMVTEYDLLTICPHPINPTVVDLSGAEYQEVIRLALDEKWGNMVIKGLGFRGTFMGKMIFEGVEVKHGNNGLSFYINGKKIERETRYQLAIPDMFTFGQLFPEIRRAEHKVFFFPEFMRDLLRWKLQNLQ